MYNSYKGRFVPKNPKKYMGDHQNIVFRSMMERRFMVWADKNPNVLQWASEEIAIPYISKIDGRQHRYFPDFFVILKDKNGAANKRVLIEVKPLKQTSAPKVPSRKTQRYIKEVLEWGKNCSKWEAAQKFCERNNMQFMFLTEKELS